MKNYYKILIITILLIPASIWADDFLDRLKQGNEAFKNKDYQTAVEHYQVAETEKPSLPELEYNLGGALFELGKYEEAVDRYTKATKTPLLDDEAAAQYNLGNTYFRMGDYQNAIQSYQKSLEINPDDMDAKYNLELARKMLKEQMKPENQQDQQNQDQQKQNQEQQKQDQQDQQNQDQNKDDQSQQNQQSQSDQQDKKDNKDDQKQNQGQQQEEKKMSKEDAERILNALKDDEKDIQKKVKRNVRGGSYTGKDW